jgi:hypothetical protein
MDQPFSFSCDTDNCINQSSTGETYLTKTVSDANLAKFEYTVGGDISLPQQYNFTCQAPYFNRTESFGGVDHLATNQYISEKNEPRPINVSDAVGIGGAECTAPTIEEVGCLNVSKTRGGQSVITYDGSTDTAPTNQTGCLPYANVTGNVETVNITRFQGSPSDLDLNGTMYYDNTTGYWLANDSDGGNVLADMSTYAPSTTLQVDVSHPNCGSDGPTYNTVKLDTTPEPDACTLITADGAGYTAGNTFSGPAVVAEPASDGLRPQDPSSVTFQSGAIDADNGDNVKVDVDFGGVLS